MIHHLQGRDLAKPCQLVFYRGQEDELYGMDYLLIQGVIDIGVILERSLVLLEPFHTKGFSYTVTRMGG